MVRALCDRQNRMVLDEVSELSEDLEGSNNSLFGWSGSFPVCWNIKMSFNLLALLGRRRPNVGFEW
jgi:hypothetical protein